VTVTYLPEPDYNGPDSFSFSATDGVLRAFATVALQVAAVDDPPVARALSRSVDEHSATTIMLQGDDAEGDALTFAIASPPQHGTLTGDPPDLIYTPDPDFSGTDMFTYTACDGQATSAAATVSVLPVNDPPAVDILMVALDAARRSIVAAPSPR
jgi:hypothetical protein